MPSKSKAQHNLMAMVANDPAKAKQMGIPQSVGADFMHADKGKKFGAGGSEVRPDRQAINQPKTQHGKSALFAKGGQVMAKKMSMGGDTTGKGASKEKRGLTMEKMAKVKTAAPSRDGLAERGKTKGKQVKMAGNTIGTGPAKKK